MIELMEDDAKSDAY